MLNDEEFEKDFNNINYEDNIIEEGFN